MQYRIIVASSSGFSITFSRKSMLERLTKEVNEAIAQGWEPLGGVSIYGVQLMQAMVKRR
jgi:hypothetical protein